MDTERSVGFLYRNTTGGGPIAFAHRGHAPAGAENTLAAFNSAVDLGYGYLELDVRTTRDGVVVVFHDETLDRLTGGTGRLEDHDWSELAGLRVAGEPLLRLEDLLAAHPDACLNVDIKDEGSVAPFASLVARHGAVDRVLVASFSDVRRRRVLRRLGGAAASSAGTVSVALAVLLGPLGAFGLLRRRLRDVAAFQVPERRGPLRVVTAGFIRRAHRAGIQVHVWVVDDRESMERLLDLGVDGLVTDRADILADVMRGRGHWPQQGPS